MNAAAETPAVDLICIDSGLFSPEVWPECVKKIHKGSGGFGKLAGLRLPQIWRKKTESFFNGQGRNWKNCGFDLFLAGNIEEILWLSENGIKPECIAVNSSVYLFNHASGEALAALTGIRPGTAAFSQEMNARELKEQNERKNPENRETESELIVYGRAPLMVTAQCLRKTSIGCDRRSSLLWMKDRTGAAMPVRNCCAFCCNTIYNSLPTVLFDLTEELNAIAPDCVRYEFTVENGSEVKNILAGTAPEHFTRGHFKRGVL